MERSKPHMLVFLGDRYGSIIDPLITKKVIARKNSAFTLDDYAISITAMEVEFGVLSGNYGSTENCVVCIRSFSPELIKDEADRMSYSAENEELAKKQQAFKEKVAKKVQGHVIEYTCDWDEAKKCLVNFRTLSGKKLSEALIDIYEEMFRADWNTYRQMTWKEKEQLAVEGLIERKLRTFQGREDLLENYYSKIKGEMDVLILQGEAGCGKTGIMCKLADRLRQEGKMYFSFPQRILRIVQPICN